MQAWYSLGKHDQTSKTSTYHQEGSQGTRLSSEQDLADNPLKEGEIVILKDDPEANGIGRLRLEVSSPSLLS